jgi:hypothetical protein
MVIRSLKVTSKTENITQKTKILLIKWQYDNEYPKIWLGIRREPSLTVWWQWVTNRKSSKHNIISLDDS